MFKLLAIRPLEGCADYIQKCLKTGMMYYFCNDYIIEPGSHIRRRSKNIKPLKEDFFTVVSDSNNDEDNSSKEKSPTVSVSAIVGMNGDGKSTLVELMMRLINNCAISYKLCASSDSLRRVKDVKAELYYMVDNVVYLMAEEKKQNETRIWKVAELNPNNEEGEELMRWVLDSAEIQKVEDDPKGSFFTIVSNYSHYAYNIYDYEKEWEVQGDEKDENEKCWLHYIFHKNDGYLTPITLHPYRDKGNMDINTEKSLSKQRLLSLFLNADNPSENDHSFRRVNGKDANILKLKEETESKLQQRAIVDFFKATVSQNDQFEMLLKEVEKFDESCNIDDKLCDPRYDEYYGSFEYYLDWLNRQIQSDFVEPIDQIIAQHGFNDFAIEVVAWLETTNNDILPNTGNIGRVIKCVDNLYKKVVQYTIALAYNDNAVEYQANADYDNALECYEKALKTAKIKLGAVHPLTARIYNNMADMFMALNNDAKGVMYYEYAKDTYYKLAKKCDKKGDKSKASFYYNKEKEMDLLMIDKERRNKLPVRRITNIHFMDEKKIEGSIKHNWRDYTKLRFLSKLSTAQLGRLDTLFRIVTSYDFDYGIVAKYYSDLSLEEKCQHYYVYKMWSILSTYPQYQYAYKKDDIKSFRECGLAMEKCIEMIKMDNSHITRKLRQVKFFMHEKLHDGGLYERLGKRDEKKEDVLSVEIDKLKEHYGGKPVPLDNLPPPIYKWDIVFNKKDNPDFEIELDSFSSGEKQLLYSIGAIIYHLQNLSNTSSGIKHKNVNLIMEEIELYYHPEFQRQLFGRLLDLIQRANFGDIQNINIIFVTHSPFILSDIPKCNVLFLKDGMPKDIMQENTFGANIHTLLKNGFFMPNLPIGEFAYGKINKLFGKLNSGELDPDNDLDEIYQEILLVGEPFLRNQLLMLYNSYKGSRVMPMNTNKKGG